MQADVETGAVDRPVVCEGRVRIVSTPAVVCTAT
jgi:hypothetical protein